MSALPPPFFGPPPSAAADPEKKSHEATWMMIGGGVGAVVAAFLPWYTVGAFTLNGTSGDGQITMVLGVILALLGFLRKNGRSSPIWLAIIVAGLIIAIGGYHLGTNSDDELVSVGVGVYATIAAGFFGIIGSTIARQNPVVTVQSTTPVAGWYADPAGEAQRYWDGTSWTEHTAEPPATTPLSR